MNDRQITNLNDWIVCITEAVQRNNPELMLACVHCDYEWLNDPSDRMLYDKLVQQVLALIEQHCEYVLELYG